MSDIPRDPTVDLPRIADRERTAGLAPPMATVTIHPPSYPGRTARQQERDAAVDQPPAQREDAAERRHRELCARLDKIADALTASLMILRQIDRRVG